jgi:hypothetical protein
MVGAGSTGADISIVLCHSLWDPSFTGPQIAAFTIQGRMRSDSVGLTTASDLIIQPCRSPVHAMFRLEAENLMPAEKRKTKCIRADTRRNLRDVH